MAIRYTDEQQAVLDADGKIIVSASAGSGKTFVMIERMLEKILSGASVDRMLALTFTNKAAAQMREKIQKSVISRLNGGGISEEERMRLKEQLSRLPMAEVSTIHAFCARLIRSHFFLADVDGAFDIIADDDADGKSLQSLALEQVFSEAYERREESFSRLLSVYFRKKKDVRLKEIISDVYRSLRVNYGYTAVLEHMRDGGDEQLFRKVTDEIFRRVKGEANYLLSRLRPLSKELKEQGNKSSLLIVVQLVSFLELAVSKEDYFALCALPMPKFNSKERVKKNTAPYEAELIDLTAYYKGLVSDFAKKHIGVLATKEEEERRLKKAQELSALLAEYVLRFDEKYTELKKERAKLDYNDLEQIALRILEENQSVREEMRGKFDFVYVDEYQDVNPVQERIISLVSGENIFLVGDVKQAIYAFRGSKSKYFGMKQEEFEKIGLSLSLTSNFRSAGDILEAVNRVFCRAMTDSVCGIEYAAAPMRGGAGYGEEKGRVAVHLLPEEKAESSERGVYSVEEEYFHTLSSPEENPMAREVLKIIDGELHQSYYDPDEKAFKSVTYGDIAVLTRKKNANVSAIIRYLSENGVPVTTANKTNACDYPEIRQLTDILSLLDNREQDIPLCSALLSGMGGLNNAELAAVRVRYRERKTPFRECVRMYAGQFEDATALKLRAFYDILGRYVTLSHILTAGELMERLIAETGLETEWLSRGDGERRMARVRAFALAAQDKNVHEFLEYLRSLNYNLPIAENVGDNAVKVLTMHASKGLEYPVVILCDLESGFHGAERDEVLFSENYAFAPRCFDEEEKIVRGTLLRNLIDMENREDELKGELNILYVAMTRAKYALHLVLREKQTKKYSDAFYAQCLADLLPLSCFEGYIAPATEIAPFRRRQALVSGAEKERKERILSVFHRPYDYGAAISLPVKTSASEMMTGVQEEYFSSHRLVPPEEIGAEKAAVGTAYHAFLEHADFSADGAEELARMREKGVLPPEQLALLSAQKVQEILSMSVFKRLSTAELYREQPFLVSLPARDFFGGESTEKTLFQGVIDLLAVSRSGVEIVDYKYSSRFAAGIKEHYAVQIKLYKKAVAAIMKIKEETIRATVVNIQLGEEIEMP